jgi:hypothetical protein
MRFQNTAETGTLTKLEILYAGTTFTGKIRLGVYADVRGSPGRLNPDDKEAMVAN